jgi:ATP-dependent Clp protease ATP-binding subunit ClpB
MTTNAGSDKKGGTVGFNRTVNEQGKEKVLKALNDFLRPEFLNRVDEIVYFNRLTEENFRDISKIMLKELQDSMKERGITLSYDDSLLDYLIKKSYSVTYGARNLRRLIQKEIEDKIAGVIIEKYATPLRSITLSADGDSIQIIYF